MKIQVSRNALKALLLFAARLDIRYYLNGVLVEATKTTTRVVAMNGHVMAIHHSKKDNAVDEAVSLIVPRAAIELLRSQGPKGGLLRDVALEKCADGWCLRDHTNSLRLGFDPIEGKFPSYLKVFPAEASGEFAHINPIYLGLLAKAAAAFKTGSHHVSIAHNGYGAAIARIETVPEFAAALMPMRYTQKACFPEWLAPTVVETPEMEPA